MKIRLVITYAILVLGFASFGCGPSGPGTNASGNGASSARTNANTAVNATANSGRTTSGQAIDNTVGKTTMGVPECDEVLDRIEAELKNPEDGVLAKAAKATVLNQIKDGIRESIEVNQRDTTRLARTCQEFRTQFDLFKAEEDAKKAQ